MASTAGIAIAVTAVAAFAGRSALAPIIDRLNQRHPSSVIFVRQAAGLAVIHMMPNASRLTFVRRARELGFSLEEVRTLLALSTERSGDTCSEVREVAAKHLVDIRAKIADLRANGTRPGECGAVLRRG